MSCGCGDNKEQNQIFVACPILVGGLSSNAQHLKVPVKSYWWNSIHQHVCNLEKKTGTTPHWSYKFYRDSFPGRNCKGLECEKYV